MLSEAIALSAIENIAKYLPRAVKDGNDIEAREHVAYGSTVAGITMQLTSTTAQHSMEHAMSAYHHNLPHGAIGIKGDLSNQMQQDERLSKNKSCGVW